MSVLSYLTTAAIRDGIQTLEGEVLTRPALLKTDRVSLTYACDVRISTDNPQGEHWSEGADPVLDPRYSERVLRTVPIASANKDLIYADVGAAVTLARSATGRFEVVGFAKRKPGKRTRVAVDLSALTAGAPEDVGIISRPLTLGELADPAFGAGFGTVPFGAYAIFRGATLIAVRS